MITQKERCTGVPIRKQCWVREKRYRFVQGLLSPITGAGRPCLSHFINYKEKPANPEWTQDWQAIIHYISFS